MTVHHFHQFSPRLASIVGVICWLFLGLFSLLPAHATDLTVGQVAIAVGEVEHVREGRTARLSSGHVLREGDRIRTGRDGMAILVFSDQARVSLRAESVLVIDRYRLPKDGQPADMRLELLRGAIRQISGDAMRADPERYRLNTPVAAIGVRGTDFLAKATDMHLETFIQEGSIVLMPLGNGCALAQDSRLCTPIDLLTATDAMRYVRLSANGERERKGVSPVELEQLFGIKLARSVPSAPSLWAGADQAPGAGVLKPDPQPEVSQEIAATEIVRSGQQQLAAALIQVGPGQSPDLSAPLSPGASPESPPAPLPMPTQLVWGRYATAASIPVTPVMTLPVSYAQASEGRHVTVGEPFEYALWREGARGSIDKGLRGLVSYSFVAGEAYFQAAGEKSGSQASIDSAKLSIDFDQSRFESAFKVSHTATGQVSIAASGRMNDEGIFTGGNNLERIAGAISKDGTEAGALFTKSIEAGTVRGISLFRRP